MKTVKGIPIEPGVPFTEDFKYKYGDLLNFNAASHHEWQEGLFPGTTDPKYDVSVGNGYRFQVKVLPTVCPRYVGGFLPIQMGHERARLRMPGEGAVSYDNPVSFIRLIHTKGENRKPTIWMSLTPMEIYTQRSGVKRAKGKVLILGLGMGWLARRVLERKQVQHVTVVERDEHILRHFGEALGKDFGDQVTLVQGDAYELGDPRVNKDYDADIALWDIWNGYSDAGWDSRYREIQKLVPCWQWGRMAKGH